MGDYSIKRLQIQKDLLKKGKLRYNVPHEKDHQYLRP